MQTILKYGILLLFTAFYSAGANAQDCFDPSPTAKTGSEYPPIRTRKLTKTEYRNIRNLLESMKGELKGTGEEISCRGNKSEPLPEVVRYTIKAKSTLDHFGHFRMEIDLYAPEERVTHAETQDFYVTEKHFRADSENSAGDVEFMEISDDVIAYRQRRALGGSAMYGTPSKGEKFTTIHRVDDGFVFIQSFYFQGIHSGKKEWHLSNF
jgi:hypothetical protein